MHVYQENNLNTLPESENNAESYKSSTKKNVSKLVYYYLV